jgi:hypothetical protein
VADAPRFEAIPDTAADVILLAGDIDIGLTGLRWAIGEAERLRRPILCVFGNHAWTAAAVGCRQGWIPSVGGRAW